MTVPSLLKKYQNSNKCLEEMKQAYEQLTAVLDPNKPPPFIRCGWNSQKNPKAPSGIVGSVAWLAEGISIEDSHNGQAFCKGLDIDGTFTPLDDPAFCGKEKEEEDREFWDDDDEGDWEAPEEEVEELDCKFHQGGYQDQEGNPKDGGQGKQACQKLSKGQAGHSQAGPFCHKTNKGTYKEARGNSQLRNEILQHEPEDTGIRRVFFPHLDPEDQDDEITIMQHIPDVTRKSWEDTCKGEDAREKARATKAGDYKKAFMAFTVESGSWKDSRKMEQVGCPKETHDLTMGSHVVMFVAHEAGEGQIKMAVFETVPGVGKKAFMESSELSKDWVLNGENILMDYLFTDPGKCDVFSLHMYMPIFMWIGGIFGRPLGSCKVPGHFLLMGFGVALGLGLLLRECSHAQEVEEDDPLVTGLQFLLNSELGIQRVENVMDIHQEKLKVP
ncbi:hypothetical protein BKA83DRAFT_4120397 [Pisolithus microcarpus]|nr:hypothetical protein BKA83DRAFT_4120397 [Pisolithus microcarpus]